MLPCSLYTPGVYNMHGSFVTTELNAGDLVKI